ncbi:MAG TPA: hypothetical protein VF606_09490 [Geminicoccaceae bacterium]
MSGSISGTASANMGLIRDALKSGDVMTVMQMLGIERASTLEEVVKGKVGDIEKRNAQVQQLNGMLAQFSVKDEKGTVIAGTPAQAQALMKTFRENPDLWHKTGHFAMSVVDANGKGVAWDSPNMAKVIVDPKSGKNMETMKTVLDAEIKRLTSDDQLAMIELQSMISKHNNAMELASSMTKKEGDLNSTIVRNMG